MYLLREKIWHLIFAESILIAIISFLGYITAYYYEREFLRYFGLPSSFINLNLTNIIVAFAACISFFVIILDTLILIISVLDKNTPLIGNYRSFIFTIVTILIFFLYFGPFQNLLLLILSIFILTISLISTFKLLLLKRVKRRKNKKKISFIKFIFSPYFEDKFSKFLPTKFGFVPIIGVIAFLSTIIIAVAGKAGETSASNQIIYPVITVDKTNYIVIRNNGETLITLPEYKKNHLKPNIHIFKSSDLQQNKLSVNIQRTGKMIVDKNYDIIDTDDFLQPYINSVKNKFYNIFMYSFRSITKKN